MNNEIDIITQCLKGNESAHKTLYNAYKGYVYTTCLRYGMHEYEIKDCIQMIFIEVFKSLHTFDSKKASFKTWLTRIAINQLLNILRKRKVRFDEIDMDTKGLVLHDFSVMNSSSLDHHFILQVISLMPEASRTVFNLFLIEGLTHDEIAKELGITNNQSRVLLHRGREWAKEKLLPHFQEHQKQTSHLI